MPRLVMVTAKDKEVWDPPPLPRVGPLEKGVVGVGHCELARDSR